MPPSRALPAFLTLVALSLPTLGAQAVPYVRVERQSATGVALAVHIPPTDFDVQVDEDGWRQVRIGDLPSVTHAGHPELPVLLATLGIPEGAEVRMSYRTAAEVASVGPPVRAVAGIEATSREITRWPDPAVYSRATPWPEERVTLEVVRFRGLRLARLLIHPVRYDAGSRELLLTPALDIQVEFIGGDGFASGGGKLLPIEDRLLRGLLNRESVASARRAAPVAADALPKHATGKRLPGTPAVKIRVGAAGLVRITRAELNGAGFDTSGVDPRNLQVSYRGTPIPCRVTGEADGSFDTGDRVEFYGVPGTGRFSRDNIYWLGEEDGPGLRFPTRDASLQGAPAATNFPARVRFEDGNTLYDFGAGSQEGDPHFFWAWFDAHNPNPPRIKQLTRAATLPGVDVTGPQATLRALFSGQTDPVEDPDHKVRFRVNGTLVGETAWNGQTLHTAEIPFDPELLVTGENSFKIELVSVASVDSYYLDWFEIDYPRSTVAASGRLAISGIGDEPTRYAVQGLGAVTDALALDVTDPLAPVRLTGVEVVSGSGGLLRFEDVPGGRSYHVVGDNGRLTAPPLTLDVPSNLRDAPSGADLIIVVPDGWEAALAPLVAHRQGQGLRVVLAGLTDVADEFAGGNVDDLAIRDFVRYAYQQWQAPALSYLLLVGEPNLDPLNYLQRTPFDHWMPTHFGVTASLGETMTDHFFGAVAGDDLLPDVAVGRLSVRSPAAAAAVVAKIIGYETAATDGAAWRSNVVRVASTSVLFEQALERATDRLPEHFTVDTEYRLSNASTGSIQSSINAGAAVVSFLGHGNVASWADSPGGSFFTTTSAQNLANSGRLPFVTALNCLNGLVGHPTQRDSLAETLVNHPTLGAVATLSPSGLGFLSEFDALQSTLYQTIFQDHVPEMGAAITQSLAQTFLGYPVSIDLITKMILTGDPSGFLAVDSDGDQVLDYHERANGLDPGDRDSDDDGLPDGAEGGAATDSDGDGIPNALDPDSDNDGLLDGLEAGLTEAGPDTDVSRGRFTPDADPATTTDPFDADSDNGGAPDGVEDLDGDGAVDAGETDPRNGADDPDCSAGTPPELARSGAAALTLNRSGQGTVLTWGALDDPCVLYRVYVAVDPDTGVGDPATAFGMRAVTGRPTYTDQHPAGLDTLRLYLVSGATLQGGEGPWGHFGR